MRKIILFFILILVGTLLFAEDNRKFPTKTGKIAYQNTGFQVGTTEIYWDNYGEKIYSIGKNYYSNDENKTIIDIATIMTPEKNVIIYNNSKSYMVDEDVDDEENVPEAEDDNLDQYKVGEEKILGKNCDVLEMDGAKLWMWKGMMLKQEVQNGVTNLVAEAKELKTDIKIDKNLFEIPAGYTQKENPMNQLFDAYDKAYEEGMKNQNQEEENSEEVEQQEEPSQPTKGDAEEFKKALKGLSDLFGE